MQFSACHKCHSIFKDSLRNQLVHLRLLRHGHQQLFYSSLPSLKSIQSVSAAPTRTEQQSQLRSLYLDTTPPTYAQLDAANKFFQSHNPEKSWTATEWRKLTPHSDAANLIPEVVFLGRSNSGKSSLLNALLQDFDLCRVGAKPGKTTLMHAWDLVPTSQSSENSASSKIRRDKQQGGDKKPVLTVLDMPGYGFGSHAEWGTDILKYLTRRRQLRRAFVLINPSHGLKISDYQTLELLRTEGISHQLIACKCDELRPQTPQVIDTNLRRIEQEVSRYFSFIGRRKHKIGLLTLSDVLAVGGLGDGKLNNNIDRKQMWGLDEVRWAMLRAAGLDGYALSSSLPGDVTQERMKSDTQITQTLTPETISGRQFISTSSSTTTNTAPEPMTKSPNIGIGIDGLLEMTGLASQEKQSKEKPKSKAKTNTDAMTKASTPTAKSPSVGVGMEGLLAMTGATSEPPKSKPRSRSKPKPQAKTKISFLRRG